MTSTVPTGARALPSGELAAHALAAGSVVAVLDGLAAILLHVVVRQATTAERVFQGIAGAVIGERAFAGGAATAALGVALHFTVACGWAGAYAALYHRWPGLRARTRTTGGAALAGLVLGAAVWLAMRFAVLPLTLAHPAPVRASSFIPMLLIHMLVVGPPITLLVRDATPRS